MPVTVIGLAASVEGMIKVLIAHTAFSDILKRVWYSRGVVFTR